MQIIIKSFNRSYYLDRCLKSIELNVSGVDSILILDDGTPKKYLDKIHYKYPYVKIVKSNQYELKSKSIENNSFDTDKLNGFKIPTDLWVETIRKTQDHFLITEDDVWFTKKIDLIKIVESMKKNKSSLVKLGWLGNVKDDQFLSIKDLDDDLTRIYPQNLFTSKDFVMDLFMFNKFKFFTILYKFKLVDNSTKRKYWALNSILMGIYKKDYWLYMWKDSKNELNEKIQLRNAAVYFHRNKKNKNFVARTKKEVMKTTFKSTASGVYHDYKDLNIDINRVNKILNEAWLNNDFDPMENYPKDFSDGYIKQFLDQENHPDAQYEEWFKWAEQFRAQYRNLGAEVDN